MMLSRHGEKINRFFDTKTLKFWHIYGNIIVKIYSVGLFNVLRHNSNIECD